MAYGEGVCDTPLRLSTCEGSKNGSVYATVGGVWWGVCDTPLRPGTCDPSKYRYDSPTGYVRSFEKPPRFRPLRGRLWGVFNTPLRPGTCGPSKNCLVFVPFGAVWWGVFNTPLQSGTCGPSKNCPVFVPFGVAGWGVCNTPLRLDTCDLSKYRCNSPTGYVRSFEIPMQSPDRIRAILRNTDTISRPEGRGRLGGGAVGATVCGGDGRE